MINNGNEITFNIDIPILYNVEDDHRDEDYEDDYEDENHIKFFLNCKEINEKLGKSYKIKENDDLIKENKKCSICMQIYKAGEYKRVLPNCTHVFHKKCIDAWFKINGTCPICRFNYGEHYLK